MERKPTTSRITNALSAFEDTIRKNEAAGGANAGMYIGGRLGSGSSCGKDTLRQSIAKNKEWAKEKQKQQQQLQAQQNGDAKSGKTPWKSSNLALVNSDLARKIREEASELEPAWKDIDQDVGTHVWRIEQFRVVPWPKDQYGQFHTGDSYIVLHVFRRGMAASLYFDVHIWIGEYLVLLVCFDWPCAGWWG